MKAVFWLACSIAVFSVTVSTAKTADQLAQMKRAMAILNRIADASATNKIKPAIRVGSIPSIGRWDHKRRIIELDTGLFAIADRYGAKSDAMLACVIGHEFAHYTRGHDFDVKFQHLFGSFTSVHDVNTAESQRLVGVQSESEADYFGLYYAVLAGYDFTADDYRRYWDDMEALYGANDGQGVHPVSSERVEIANKVLDEIKLLARLHDIANISLLSGQYLQAGVLYEYVAKDVNIPSVSWNELLARLLLLQELAKRELVDAKLLREQYVGEYQYRSSDLHTKLDVQQVLYRCQSLVDIIKVSGFNADGLVKMQRLIDLMGEAIECKSCQDGQVCKNHALQAKTLTLAMNDKRTLARKSSQVDLNQKDVEAMLKVTERLDMETKDSPLVDVPVAIGRARFFAIESGGRTYLRFYYRAPKSRSEVRIDVEIKDCPSCMDASLAQHDNMIHQVRPGKIVKSAQFVE